MFVRERCVLALGWTLVRKVHFPLFIIFFMRYFHFMIPGALLPSFSQGFLFSQVLVHPQEAISRMELNLPLRRVVFRHFLELVTLLLDVFVLREFR